MKCEYDNLWSKAEPYSIIIYGKQYSIATQKAVSYKKANFTPQNNKQTM